MFHIYGKEHVLIEYKRYNDAMETEQYFGKIRIELLTNWKSERSYVSFASEVGVFQSEKKYELTDRKIISVWKVEVYRSEEGYH